MGRETKKFKVTHSKKVGNANLYAAIVTQGGDKRVAALAAKAHPDMNPNANPHYVTRKSNQTFNDQTKKSKEPPKPKRERKHSPPQVRRVRKK